MVLENRGYYLCYWQDMEIVLNSQKEWNFLVYLSHMTEE